MQSPEDSPPRNSTHTTEDTIDQVERNKFPPESQDHCLVLALRPGTMQDEIIIILLLLLLLLLLLIIIIIELPMHTDCEIKAELISDIILKCKNENSYLLIDIAIPTDRNISIKRIEKLSNPGE